MKNFLSGIFIWFFVQLMFLSAFGQMQTIARASWTQQQFAENCKVEPFVGFLAGAIFPITQFTFVKGGWCWEI